MAWEGETAVWEYAEEGTGDEAADTGGFGTWCPKGKPGGGGRLVDPAERAGITGPGGRKIEPSAG